MTDAVGSTATRNPSTETLGKRWLKPGTVLFCDFDGPLIDVSERYYTTYQLGLVDTQALYTAQGEALPLNVLTKAEFWHLKRNRTPDPEIAKRSGLAGDQIEVFLNRVTQIVNQPTLLHQDTLQPRARLALSLLCTYGVQLVLVTLRDRQQALQILQECGLAGAFSRVYGTSSAEAAYHNYADHKTTLLGEAIAEATRQGWQPGWMIGDTEADILAGQAHQLPTIALTCGIRSRLCLELFKPSLIHQDLLSATHDLLGLKRQPSLAPAIAAYRR